MNRNLLSSRVRKRIAAAAATAVGAAVLAAPGAVAQAPAATGLAFDYDADGDDDLLTIATATGELRFFAGEGDGTFDPAVSLGSGWGGRDIAMAGDLTGDGHPDLLARDNKTGTLHTYPGDGDGGLAFGSRITVGTGWNGIGAFTSAGDYDGDGKLDLLAVRKADGNLYLYPGRGNGTFGQRREVGRGGWNAMDTIATFGDVDGDGKVDLLARKREDDWFYLYWGDGTGTFEQRQRRELHPSLAGPGDPSQTYRQMTAGGDYDGNGHNEIMTVDGTSGEMLLHSYSDSTLNTLVGRVVGSGWNAHRLPGPVVDNTYDFTGDGRTDVLAKAASSGESYIYPGNGSGGLTARRYDRWLEDVNLVQTAGDLTGDGNPDFIARHVSGELDVHPSDGYLGEGAILIGGGWNSMSVITGGHDHDSDGKADVIAVEKSTGHLWFYPGKGAGKLGSRVNVGTGWTSMREVTAVGDLDHDGHADMIAVKNSDGCLYFYGGRGNGTFKSRVQIGCSWGGYDSLTAVGDFNGEGHADWLARRKSDGALFLYKGNGSGGYLSRVQIGTGWNSMTIA
jgi:hypothetical protein